MLGQCSQCDEDDSRHQKTATLQPHQHQHLPVPNCNHDDPAHTTEATSAKYENL